MTNDSRSPSAATPAAPPGFEEIQRLEFSRLFGQMAVGRVAVLPLAYALLAAGYIFEPAPWRRAFFVYVAIAITSFFLFEYLRFKKHGITPRSIPMNLSAAVIGVTLVSGSTGGLESPAVFIMVPIACVIGIAVEPGVRLFLLAAQVAGVWLLTCLNVFAVVPDLNLAVFGGGARSGHSDVQLWTTAFVLTGALAIASGIGRVVRRAFDRMVRRALAAQDESLRANSEATGALAALSGEIAHELKNPLASIKGLAGLLAQNVPEGKGAERLVVLRREVERMQGILEGFLNFSRPLVPLCVTRTNLAVLCAEVCALHEGMARERGVELVFHPGSAAMACDPRKVKQVLINMLQNAIEASPAKARVEIELSRLPDEGARISVLDRGSGVPKEIRDRVFDPGVTTKANGSGLGLTIARTLARQHGGELTIEEREGGGTTAILVLASAPSLAPSAPAGESAAGSSGRERAAGVHS